MAGKEVQRMLKRMKDWLTALPRPVKWLLLILVVPLGWLIVSCTLLLLWVVLMIGLMCMSGEVRTGPEHYQYIFERSESKRDGLLGYGEYMYNSYMLLFPRETPPTLEEFYFCWEPLIDVDGFAVYFTCELTAENYAGFAAGLADFAMHTEQGEIRPVYDTEHFQHPTYILQWLDVEEKWEVLEYIMLDEANHTVAFVYHTLCMADEVEENSAYTTTPSEWDILSPGQKQRGELIPAYHDEGFSIYADFEDAVYDLSFLEYLN